ncbi:MAG TPA: chemotaxis protein CheB [Kineosporiaceae bacterium]|nr:chemotaxis protein CheB [Kineosporiaceae bacterium]
MSQRDTVVIGASAGGVAALQTLLGGLPAEFPARILVVLHVPPSGVNALAAVLARASSMKVRSAQNQDRLEPGVVLVARPDHHLLVADDSVLLTRGPRENGHRPAIDVLFRSAARALGPRTIAVVLSGALDDGSAGLRTIRAQGGLGIVQDPDDAQHPGMPLNAIHAAHPEYVVPVAAMPELLTSLVGVEVPDSAEGDPDLIRLMETEVSIAELTAESLHESHRPGTAAGFACPDCQGTLFTIGEEDFARFRCRVGHAWSLQSLLAEHRTAVEGALWMALRALEEKAALCIDMSKRAGASGASISARRFIDQATDARAAAELVRGLIASGTEADLDYTREGGRLA